MFNHVCMNFGLWKSVSTTLPKRRSSQPGHKTRDSPRLLTQILGMLKTEPDTSRVPKLSQIGIFACIYIYIYIYIYIVVYVQYVQYTRPQKKKVVDGFKPSFAWCRTLKAVHRIFILLNGGSTPWSLSYPKIVGWCVFIPPKYGNNRCWPIFRNLNPPVLITIITNHQSCALFHLHPWVPSSLWVAWFDGGKMDGERWNRWRLFWLELDGNKSWQIEPNLTVNDYQLSIISWIVA